MGNAKLNLLATALLSGALLFGCGLKKMVKKAETVDYTVTPDPLEVHGDSIEITVKGNFPKKYFHKDAVVEATPVLMYNGKEKKFGTVTVHGQDAEGEGATVNYKEGGDFTYTAAIPYEKGMEEAELKLKAEARIPDKDKSAELPTVDLADGTIITATRVKDGENVSVAPHGYDKDAITRKRSTIHFPINSAYIRGSEKRSEDMDKLRKFSKKGIRFKNVDITAAASPDGKMDFNKDLANKRAQNTFEYISSEMNKLGVEKANDKSFFKITTIAEDMDGFIKAVEESDLEKKDEILKILNANMDDQAWEEKLETEYASTWNGPLANDILPSLRRSDVDVNAFANTFSDKQIQTYVKENPDTLSATEYLYAASMAESIDEELKIYKTFMKAFPKNWKGYNNAGYVYTVKGDWDKAEQMFNKAKELEPKNGHVLNNLAMLAMKNGEYGKAEDLLKKAQDDVSDSKKIKHNMGTLALHKGEYDKARRYFGDACTYNAALLKVVTDNAEAAKKTMECSKDKTAEGYYLRAIIGARTNDMAAVKENLQKAIKLNTNYKEEAKNDLEFAEYHEDSEFKEIVK